MPAALLTCSRLAPPDPAVHLPRSGEVTATSALMRTRAVSGRGTQAGRFERATDEPFADARRGEWRLAVGPDRPVWGEERYEWLTRTLKESDAAFEEPRLRLIFNLSNESVPADDRHGLKSRAYRYDWYRKDGR